MRGRSLGPVALLAALGGPAYGQASAAEPSAGRGKAEKAALAEIGAKLSNPVSEIWALFTEFDLTFSDGNLSRGGAKVGGRMIFQPILPVPLYGSGRDEWKLITRPTIPVIFSQPVPAGVDHFRHEHGLGDTQLPMPVSPPLGNWIVGVGPCWLFPTATNDAFGRGQWGVGPSAIVGYKSKDWLAVAFPQYYVGNGSSGVPGASYLNMLYAVIVNLPDAWQVGFNPTITYDHRAAPGNQWNVPVGLFVAKTTKIGPVPVKLQLGLEYSVVSQDDFGQRAQIKLNVIPVIPALVSHSIFGGQ